MQRQDESSSMVVPKWRVFRPDDDMKVLLFIEQSVEEKNARISFLGKRLHFPLSS